MTTLNSTALLVEWDEPLSVRGDRNGYRIRYELSDDDSFLNTTYIPTIIVCVNVSSQILTELHEFAAYEVTVQAENDKGFGDIAMETRMTDQSGRLIFEYYIFHLLLKCTLHLFFFSVFFSVL